MLYYNFVINASCIACAGYCVELDNLEIEVNCLLNNMEHYFYLFIHFVCVPKKKFVFTRKSDWLILCFLEVSNNFESFDTNIRKSVCV